MDQHALEMTRKLADGLLDLGPSHSRILLRVLRKLAEGQAVTKAQVGQITSEEGLAADETEEFLAARAERDPQGAIVGIAGLSLNSHPHRLILNGKRFSTWCAEDSLFLPYLLDQEGVVVSRSPESGKAVRLRVAPDGVKEVTPASAVISIALVDPEREHLSSVEAVWNVFCRHVHFFASQEEAEVWTARRDDIAVVTVEEGFDLGRRLWSRVMSYSR